MTAGHDGAKTALLSVHEPLAQLRPIRPFRARREPAARPRPETERNKNQRATGWEVDM
jgi:hypothetical protein